MHRLVFLAAMTFCSAAVAAVSIDFVQLHRSYEKQIRFVGVCGSWRQREDRGFFRFTEAYIHAQSFLYAQWMREYDSSNALTDAVITLSFGDVFNDHAEIELSNIRCEEQSSGVRVFADAYFGHEEEHRRMILDLFSEPGKYSLEFFPSNKALQPIAPKDGAPAER
jgi:hypothetical protein